MNKMGLRHRPARLQAALLTRPRRGAPPTGAGKGAGPSNGRGYRAEMMRFVFFTFFFVFPLTIANWTLTLKLHFLANVASGYLPVSSGFYPRLIRTCQGGATTGKYGKIIETLLD